MPSLSPVVSLKVMHAFAVANIALLFCNSDNNTL